MLPCAWTRTRVRSSKFEVLGSRKQVLGVAWRGVACVRDEAGIGMYRMFPPVANPQSGYVRKAGVPQRKRPVVEERIKGISDMNEG
jgi:hypothetical protein